MKQFKDLFLNRTPLLVSLIGICLAILVIPFYLSGYLDGLDDYIQDNFYRTRFVNKAPNPNIVVIAITDQTSRELGAWPIPRSNYITLLQKLKQGQAKAIGFNLMIAAPNTKEPETDRVLVELAKETPNLVMPFFYDYSTNSSMTPMEPLKAAISAVGNVATYPGNVTHFIEAQLVNPNATPRQVIFPMGLELARLYLGLSNQDVRFEAGRFKLGPEIVLPLEKNNLIRINYLGPPGFYKKVSFEDIVKDKVKVDFKDKLVLIGTFTPTLADYATNPYGDQTSKPIYGTELQAQLAQNFIEKTAMGHLPAWVLAIFLLIFGATSGLLFPRFGLSRQVMILIAISFSLLLISYLSFNLLALLIDTSLVFLFSLLMSFSLFVVISIRSQVALNDQIAKIQDYERQLPEGPPPSGKIDHILTTFLYITQANWIGFRQFDAEKKQLILREVKSRDPEVSYEVLPPYFMADFVESLPAKLVPIDYTRLPETMKQAYDKYRQGQFILLSLTSKQQNFIGLIEIYFDTKMEFDDLATQLLQDLYQVTVDTLSKIYSKDTGRARDLFPGVEEKIESLASLYRKTRDESAFFLTVLKSTTNPVVVCNQLGEINFYNENFVNTLRLDEDHNLTHENIMELMGRIFSLQAQQWQDIWQTTIYRRRQKEVQVNTEWGVYHLTLTPVINSKQEVTGVVMILTDVTKLHRQANYDKLTGLYNRRYFDELIMKEFQRCQRNPEKPFTLLLMDIDHFKSFNDTYGHQVGDQVLASFGQVLAKTVRRTDMPVRYGGEEMAVILPATLSDNGSIAAEKVRLAVESMQLYDLEGNPIRQITTSIGVAMYSSRDAKPDDVLRRADDALYKCKAAGRNCIHVHKENQGIVKYNPNQLHLQV